jgi:hypothetical protein
MAEEFLTVELHNEFAKRIEETDKRQDHRITELEQNFKVVQELVVSTRELAVSMETMAKELEKQGNCLRELEFKPVKRWELVVTSVITGIIGALLGMMMKGLLP